MTEEYPETSRKRIYVLLFLLLLLGGTAVFLAMNVAEPKSVLAVQDAKSDAGKADADSKRLSDEPNLPPAGNEPPETEPNEPNRPFSEPNQPGVREVNDPNNKEIPRPVHRHPAYTERIGERARMVEWQIEARSVKDPNVLMAMRVVPRHAFVRQTEQRFAYTDSPLPIGYDQTISQPYIVAFMTEKLKLTRNSKVLEIGTGSGYQAAVCAEIAKAVYTIEIVEELAESAKKRLKELGYRNVFVKAGDGFFGWPEHASFDAIIGTAAAGRIPEPLIEQLKPGGRMILPYGSPRGFQSLVIITKDKDGNISRKDDIPVRFVPMTGQVQKPEE